ncbi:unnamed protein product [Rhodiola kirilowii]
MSFVEWAYIKLHGENSLEVVMFYDTLNSLYEAYVDRWSSQTSSRDHVNEGCSYSQDEDTLFQNFDSSYNNATSSSVSNELQSYLDEQRLDRKMELDVLGWWKKEEFRYPILSRLAGDMLMIPVSTVASESAFSIAGRVLDQYPSSLLPETVQALLCSRD